MRKSLCEGTKIYMCDCQKCPRLAEFIRGNKELFPSFFNAPVPSFGDKGGQVLVVGLAPGLKGANRTGRPFTGDYAGDLLYATLQKFGFLEGEYKAAIDDGIVLKNIRITNAVRCVPPENKVTGEEVKNCNALLKGEIALMPNLKVIIALGTVAHNAVLMAMGRRQRDFVFAHASKHDIGGGVVLIDSYHCSRYNTSTKRLTTAMFEDVFAMARQAI